MRPSKLAQLYHILVEGSTRDKGPEGGPSHEPVAAYRKVDGSFNYDRVRTGRGLTWVNPSGSSMSGLGIVCRRLWYRAGCCTR